MFESSSRPRISSAHAHGLALDQPEKLRALLGAEPRAAGDLGRDVPRSSVAKPLMLVSGVVSSWLTLARNSDFIRSASDDALVLDAQLLVALAELALEPQALGDVARDAHDRLRVRGHARGHLERRQARARARLDLDAAHRAELEEPRDEVADLAPGRVREQVLRGLTAQLAQRHAAY